MVFVGVGNPPDLSWPAASITNVAQAPVVREKPFLVADANGNVSVRVPALRVNSSAVSCRGGSTPGKDSPIDRVYIARPDIDAAASVNARRRR